MAKCLKSTYSCFEVGKEYDLQLEATKGQWRWFKIPCDGGYYLLGLDEHGECATDGNFVKFEV